MAAGTHHVSDFLAELYATALGEQSWLDTLGSFSKLFGAVGVNVFDFSRLTHAPLTVYIGDGNDAGQSEYVEYIHSIDPRLNHAIKRRGKFISLDYDVLPEEAMRRHEYYDWLARVCDMKYHIGTKFIDDGDVMSCLSIELGARRGPPESEEIELLEFLTPHIANSWRMSQRLAQARRIDDFNMQLLESVPWGVVTLGFQGGVLSVNRLARKIISRDDGLLISRGELRARKSADDRTLQSEIGSSLSCARGEGYHSGGTVAVGRAGEQVPYAVRVMPLRHMTGPLPDGLPFVSVVIADLASPQVPDVEDLRVILGFSPREAQLSLLLAHGMTLGHAATTLGIAPGTARAHLANAFAKAGKHTQTSLIGLIRSLPGQNEPS